MKKIVILGYLAVTAFSWAGFAQINRIVAKVNNEIITERDLASYKQLIKYRLSQRYSGSELRKKLKSLEEGALESLIEDRLIVQAAKKEGMKIPSRMVNERLEQIISNYPSYSDFEEELIRKGINVAILRKRIREKFLTEFIVKQKIKDKIFISPQDVTKFYNEHPELFKSKPRYYCWVFKTKDREKAFTFYTELIKSGFKEIKSKYKEELFYLNSKEGQLRKDIAEVVTQLKNKEASVPRLIGGYYFVFYLEKKVPSVKLGLDQAKERIYNYLFEKEFRRRLGNWVNKLKKDAIIENYENNLQN